ncbi:MAG: hypothetical protein K0R29_282 [Pseudobdellovibrio sp.]|jgi:hypothetical protein|nr:hypothetical protein [Pseudobdellovibrio sp.]
MFKMNKKGMGMVEVMVAAAMAAMVSLGVATMMQNSMKESRRVSLLDALKNKKILFDNMMRDPDVWNATLNNNVGVPFTQLKTTTNSTSEIPYTNPVEFQMYNSDGSLAYDLLGPSDMTGNGFTEKGGTCSTFNANPGSGTDNCPFSYRLLVGVDCPVSGALACTNPNLKLVARLVYNASPTGAMSAFANFIAPVSGFSIADGIVDNKYDSVIKRTSTSINRSFRLVSGFSPTIGGCANMSQGGGGQCTSQAAGVSPSGTYHPRTNQAGANVTNGLWSEGSAQGGMDPYNLVSVGAVGTGQFSFGETGYYGCTISVPAFATKSFTAIFRNITRNSDVAQQTITAGKFSQAVAVIDTKFNVTSTGDAYAVWQKCEETGASPDVYPFCTLGIPSTTYDGSFQSLITVTCYKLDKSM